MTPVRFGPPRPGQRRHASRQIYFAVARDHARCPSLFVEAHEVHVASAQVDARSKKTTSMQPRNSLRLDTTSYMYLFIRCSGRRSVGVDRQRSYQWPSSPRMIPRMPGGLFAAEQLMPLMLSWICDLVVSSDGTAS